MQAEIELQKHFTAMIKQKYPSEVEIPAFTECVVQKYVDNKAKRCFQKTKHVKFSEKWTFLAPWYANVSLRISG